MYSQPATTPRYRDNVRTARNHWIVFPGGFELRVPTCSDCLKQVALFSVRLERARSRKGG